MSYRLISAALLISFAAEAAACEAIDAFASGDLGAASGAFTPAMATCNTSRQQSGEVVYCYAEHPFRSTAATRMAERLEADILACFGPKARVTVDDAVNHPDSYAAKTFAANGLALSLSVKDKGASGKTLVFLRGAPD